MGGDALLADVAPEGLHHVIDSLILVSLFAGYTWRVSRAPAEEPHLVGPARYLGSFPVFTRRAWVIGLFLASGTAILLFAEPFAHSLQEAGKQLGISEFLLVQRLAPPRSRPNSSWPGSSRGG